MHRLPLRVVRARERDARHQVRAQGGLERRVRDGRAARGGERRGGIGRGGGSLRVCVCVCGRGHWCFVHFARLGRHRVEMALSSGVGLYYIP